ncbi:TraC family protein [Sinorhizobium sp. CCBAU 05631]|uniref:TraC family protein n=1 Tax=Sinorhizobium sp. CCBAU 05631 TaxID=794846 RepID=UPI001FCBB3A1|nr:TraC family protein [Sinorhizobium sp. CCBAU 05631]
MSIHKCALRNRALRGPIRDFSKALAPPTHLFQGVRALLALVSLRAILSSLACTVNNPAVFNLKWRSSVARTTKVSKIQEEIAKLQEQLKAAQAKEAERLGDLAVKAGLSDLDVSDRDLLKALKEVADRFRKAPAQ